MKSIKYILITIALIFASATLTDAQYSISEQDIEEITLTLNKPLNVYMINTQQNILIFENINTWTKNKGGFTLSKSEPLKLSYTKNFGEPAKTAISKEEAKEISLKLISSNNFIFITPEDQIKESNVHSLVRQKIDSLKTDKEICLHRTILKRSVNGIEVENSKFILDVHPENKNVIAVKSFNWTPLNEKSEKWEYKTKKQLVNEIDSVYGKLAKSYKIGKKELKYYQTSKYLIPIIKINLIPKDQSDVKPIIVNYSFSLIKDDKRLEIPERKDNVLPQSYVEP